MYYANKKIFNLSFSKSKPKVELFLLIFIEAGGADGFT